MGCWKTDGVAGFGRFNSLAAPLSAIPTNTQTIAWLGRRNHTAAWSGLIAFNDSGASVDLTMAIDTSDGLYYDTAVSSSNTDGVATVTTTDVRIIVFNKGDAMNNARYHVRNLTSSTTEFRANFPALLDDGNGTPGGTIDIGARAASFFANAWHGLVGCWNVNLTDAQVDQLWANKRTSDWWLNSGGTPQFLVELTSTTPVDIAKRSAFVSFNGTIDGAETLASWNFNGTGARTGNRIRRVIGG